MLPVVKHTGDVEEGSVGQEFGHRENPSMSFKTNVSDWILDKSKQIFESSFLIALVDALLSEAELF